MPDLTPAQLEQYYKHIHLPQKDQPTNLSSLDEQDQLKCLIKLLHHQLCYVPFENFDLHYSAVKGVSLDPTFLFHKIVTRASGRGGYCMQNNSFFASVLRTIGFRVRSVGARVSRDFHATEPEYSGWSHQVNIVSIGKERYMVDVGFGNEGPTVPMSLSDESKILQTGDSDQAGYYGQVKAVYDEESQTSSYIYQMSRGGTAPYTPRYSFTKMEFLSQDFEVMSFHVANSRKTMFVQNVICTKFLLAEDGKSIVGDITLNNNVLKERRYGKSEPLAEIQTESDRVQALEKFMGIKMLPEEIAGIQGLPTELKSQ
ncbi:hypothetical protein BT93_L4825 [Corymbia citriodora subsp. variegata]|uniref:Arylamine N-acetyltransferase n=1 Tax=Corymbia citriodora subsp. variegata TaxID=360336 RepID=A0A8T0CJQ6_CORYI|nr:hypothetical protein BT93_L4825 [Corymbia citriodora subsp. variegata]